MGASAPLRAIMVSVNYADLLRFTLPRNRKHFTEMAVVTDNKSGDGDATVAFDNRCAVFRTDAFYDNGAVFNKWKALEQGLDWFGRRGCLCVMDADVVWPDNIPDWAVEYGFLYSPLRRMLEDTSVLSQSGIPSESEWKQYPVHRNVREWAGYSQIYWASDPVLGPPPWHQIDWRHAGGADSFFQEKWPESRKVRPPFEVLHLGPAGQNWFGRASALSTGEVPPDAAEKAAATAQIWRGRAERRRAGLDPFVPERLSSPS